MVPWKIFMALAGVLTVSVIGAGGVLSKVDGPYFDPPKTGSWVQAHHTRVRLIAGGYSRSGQNLNLQAGVHIELDKGWKTYWRTPGGSGGVPPYFSWEGSKNLKSAEVHYPAPSRILSEDGTSIGYKGEVVFPINVEAVDPTQPVHLALRMDYGVCRDICVPVQADLGLEFGTVRVGRGSYGRVDAQLLKQYSLKVPVRSNVPEGKSAMEGAPLIKDAPHIKSIRINLEGPSPKLVVEAVYPRGAEGADLFVEAPEGLYIALPTREPVGDGKGMRFLVDLTKGEDPKYLVDKELRLTLVGGGRQSESRWRVPSK